MRFEFSFDVPAPVAGILRAFKRKRVATAAVLATLMVTAATVWAVDAIEPLRDGDILTAEDLNSRFEALRTAVLTVEARLDGAHEVLSVRKTGEQRMGSGRASLTFDTVRLESLAGWQLDQRTFIAPKTGVYRFDLHVQLQAAPGTGTRYVLLVAAGRDFAGRNSQPAGENATAVTISDMYKLNQGDLVTVELSSDAGNFVVGDASGLETSTYLNIQFLGH